MGPTTAFDPSPLVEPVDPAAVRAYAVRNGLVRPGASRSRGSGILVAIFVVVGVVFGFSVVVTASSLVARIAADGLTLPLLGAAVVATFGTAAIVVGVVRAFRPRSGMQRQYRLDRFARANGMTFDRVQLDPRLPGMLFQQGGGRKASDIVRAEQPRHVEVANYRYVIGTGRSRAAHHWGYVAVRLDVPLPHIVLDAKSNNTLLGSNLPAAFDRNQRLRLEGDFDQHFTLYCPRDYETDALYLFTPDIMARFIDNAAALDVEIIDDWLFLYAKRDLSTLDPATWTWLFTTTTALTDKLAQWGRWRDDTLAPSAAALPFAAPPTEPLTPPPGVASDGRRLSGRIRIGPLIGFLLVFGLLIAYVVGVLTDLPLGR